MQVKFSQASQMVVNYIKAGLVPMLTGSPGCGKSQMMHAIAEQFNLKVIDLRLSQCDPTDIGGFPRIVDGKASYAPMDTFPIEGDPLPVNSKGLPYKGWMLFLDEFNSAPPAVQAASYKLVLDRMVGNHKLHKNVAIVAAGNLESDNAIVQPMSTALQSRLVHIELQVDHKEWLDWAADAKLDHRINSYINYKPGSLYTFNPDHSDKTYASPRTWEFANRILGITDISDPIILPMLTGALSEGVAREFLGFCKIYKSLPSLGDITRDPEGIKVPLEPSVLFALTGSIAHNADESNLGQFITFIKRVPIEFQVVCIREIIRRHKGMANHPAVNEWVKVNAKEII